MSFIVRLGLTTGSCAAAAAKAATLAALGWRVDRVVIPTPIGLRVEVRLTHSRPLGSLTGEACVRKDAGDDAPNDVTHGALICAEVRLERVCGVGGGDVRVEGGEGVGLATAPGLPVKPGEPAINPTPREFIARAVKEVLPKGFNALVKVWVPGGEEIARRTDNLRLGIVNGISILGNTGFVIPYSSTAWIGSLTTQLRVLRALKADAVALTSGRDTREAVIKGYGVRDELIVNCGHYLTPLAIIASRMGFSKVLIIAKPAKALKLMIGAYIVSKEFVDGRFEALTHLLLSMHVKEYVIDRALKSKFINEFLAWLASEDPGLLKELMHELASRVERSLSDRVEGNALVASCVNYRGELTCTDNGWEVLKYLRRVNFTNP